MPRSVLHLERGVRVGELLALTDAGLSRVTAAGSGEGSSLLLEPLIEDEPVLAHSASFYSRLQIVHDVDGDGTPDVLLPSRRGLTVYRGGADGLIPEAVERIEVPANWRRDDGSTSLWYPYPEVRSIDGDDLPDLVFSRWNDEAGGQPRHVFLGEGGGRFRPLRSAPPDTEDAASALRLERVEPLAAGDAGTATPSSEAADDPANRIDVLRDLDGDGKAEAVVFHMQSRGDGLRKGLKDAKRPKQDVRFHRLTEELDLAADPYYEVKVVGHAAEIDEDDTEGFLPAGLEQFADLDGDGREDLVTITLDFSLFQVIKVMMTKKIGVGVDFHVYAQRDDGTFDEVPGLDLHEKLKFDLNQLEIGRFAQFAGDFDGDGRQEFVHFGRGDAITIHRGQSGCRYPKQPDLVIELAEEPKSIDLIEIEDLNDDGRADLRIIRPLESSDPDVTAPVALDLYLSEEGP